jgi:hypothetical protein
MLNKYESLYQSRTTLTAQNNILKTLKGINGIDNNALTSIDGMIDYYKKLDRENWKTFLTGVCHYLPDCSNETFQSINKTVDNQDYNLSGYYDLTVTIIDKLGNDTEYLTQKNNQLYQLISRIQLFATFLNILGLAFISLASYYGHIDKFTRKGFIISIALIILFTIIFLTYVNYWVVPLNLLFP